MQGCFNNLKSINIVHHLKKMKDKNHMIIAIHTEKVLKDIMAKVFPNLINTINPQILEAQKNSNTIVLIKITPMHVIIHLLIIGDQKENLKASEKQRHITKIRNKDKDGYRFIVRNSASGKALEQLL